MVKFIGHIQVVLMTHIQIYNAYKITYNTISIAKLFQGYLYFSTMILIIT